MVRNRIVVCAAVAASGFLLLVGPAWAQTLPGTGCSQPCPAPPAEVSPSVGAPAVAQPVSAVAPAVPARVPSGAIPLTGADVAEMIGIGVAAVGVGLVLHRRSRARA